MKRAIIGIILLLASPAWADMNCYMTGSFGSAAPAGCSPSDAFGSDSSADYTALHGGMTISSGTAKGSGTWAMNSAYYDVCAPGASSWIQADVTWPAQDGTYVGYVLARVNTSNDTGYGVHYDHTASHHRVILSRFSGTTHTAIAWGGDNLTGLEDGTLHTIKLVANGTSLKVYVDGSATPEIDTTDGTYTTGGSIGFMWNVGGAGSSAEIDNFSGGAN